MKTRAFTALLTVALAAILIVGCGGGSPSTVVTVTATPDDAAQGLVGDWVEPDPMEGFAAETLHVEATGEGDYAVRWDLGTLDGDDLGDMEFTVVQQAIGVYLATGDADVMLELTGESTLEATYVASDGEPIKREFVLQDGSVAEGEETTEPEDAGWTDSYPDLSKIEYQRKCRDIKYKVLEKDCDRLVGRLYRFTGQIFQIQDAGEGQYFSTFGEDLYPQTQILLAVTPDEWGYWDDNVMVLYDKGVNVYEDDVIRVWCECLGNYTYESVAGYNITVPMLWAKYIQKQ